MNQMIPLFDARWPDLKATLRAWKVSTPEERDMFIWAAREYLSTLMGNPQEETEIIVRRLDQKVTPDDDDDGVDNDVYIGWPE